MVKCGSCQLRAVFELSYSDEIHALHNWVWSDHSKEGLHDNHVGSLVQSLPK